MPWTGVLFALLVAAATGSPGDYPTDEWVPPLIFPDGAVPDLVPRHVPAVRNLQTRSSCPADCDKPTAGKGKEDNATAWRLNGDVIPSAYKLILDVDIEKFFYSGSVKIDIEARNATNKITLHSLGLKIDNTTARVLSASNAQVYAKVTNITEDKEHEMVTLNLDKELGLRRKYVLHLDFNGEIRKEFNGFYRGSYEAGGQTRWLASTQFEPTYARKAFPCFDEPNMKATFSIAITHDQQYRAISNMPIENSARNGNRITDTFETTVPMSTYLVAFVVSDFKNYSANSALSNVWATQENIKDAAYGQEIGLKTLRSMERYTDIPFSLPKMDHVALPNFSAGAMENWGIITYRDYLLIKKNDTPINVIQAITTVIAHEMAHQWFGDLVTTDWWSSIWLNEGFATFFETYVTEEITGGKWNLWDQFITQKFQVAMSLDAYPETSIPMTSNVSTPRQISSKFDQITYGKGGCVLRMFSEILKPQNLRTGLQRYLRLRQFKNAVPDDLFEQLKVVAIETSALPKEVDFTAFAKSWTEQDGVPVVTAIRNYETGEVSLTQKRFYLKKPPCACDYNRQWWIPISWNYRNRTNARPDDFSVEAWLHGDLKNETLLIKPGVQTRNWLLLNVRSVGYFHVNYDTRNWLLLTTALSEAPANFSVANRAQIISDAHSLASADELDFPIALGLLNFLVKERDTSVWLSGIRLLSMLYDNIGPTPANLLFEEFARNLVNETYLYVTLGVSANEPHLKSLLRFSVAPFACVFGLEQCLKDATDYLRYYQDNVSVIHPDVVAATLCGAVRAANETVFKRIRKSVDKVNKADAKNSIIAALVCTTDNKIFREHLEDAIKPDSEFPKGLVTNAITAAVTAPTKFSVAFEFLMYNLDATIEKIGKRDARRVIVALIKKIRLKSHHKQVGDWLSTKLDRFDDKDKLWEDWKKAEEKTEWNSLHLADVAEWLAASLGRDPPTGISPRPGKSSAISSSASVLLMAALFVIKRLVS